MQLLSYSSLLIAACTFSLQLSHVQGLNKHPTERNYPARLRKDKLESPSGRSIILGPDFPTPKEQDKNPNVTVIDYNVVYGDTKLTTSGTLNTTFDSGNIWPSGDGKFVVVFQFAQAGTGRTVTLVESSPPEQVQPKLHVNNYDKPGDDLRNAAPRLFDLEKKKQIELNHPELYGNPFAIQHVGWSKDSKKYRFLYNERGHKTIRMLEVDLQGKVTELILEEDEKFIDWTNKVAWDFFNETDQMWWMSERDGHNHIYLYNTTTGDQIQQVTKGEFEVYNVEHIDEKAKKMWFRGFGMVKGQDPYYMHLGKVNLDGTGYEVLTKEDNGYHRFVWVDNYTRIEDRWSRLDMPMKGVLRDLDGKVLKKLEARVEDKLLPNVTLSAIETFNTTARDGNTLIYGNIYKPRSFDPNKKYAILENVYAGPQDWYVNKDLTVGGQYDLADYQKLADELDVVVVSVDGLGTNWRGKQFQQRCYKDLKDAGFEDRIKWIKTAAKDRPWMNLDMVGIYGTSAGGQNALGALLWYGDFYKAAIADSGCHDNRMDKIWWNEQWMGWPVDNSYAMSSNVVHAGRMNGKLLLLVGELDENVDPSSTMQVVNALNAAGKSYEMLLVPGAPHGVLRTGSFAPDVQTMVNNFWKKWLAGA